MDSRDVYWSIIPKGGHYELLIDGKFHCSADTWEEAFKEWQEYYEEHCV